MIVLALTTSTDNGSVAVSKNKKLLAQKKWTRKTQHSEVLTVHIKGILRRARLEIEDVSHIAVDRGPGSFTGCRMAVNAARTMGYTLKIPLFATSSLDIMAYQCAAKSKGTIWCFLNAHKSLLYAKKYESDGKKISFDWGQAQALSLGEILRHLTSEALVVGEIPSDFRSEIASRGVQFLKGPDNFPQASTLAKMTLDYHGIHGLQNWSEVEPSYIRAPEIKINPRP